jgi:hypothetical protein
MVADGKKTKFFAHQSGHPKSIAEIVAKRRNTTFPHPSINQTPRAT